MREKIICLIDKHGERKRLRKRFAYSMIICDSTYSSWKIKNTTSVIQVVQDFSHLRKARACLAHSYIPQVVSFSRITVRAAPASVRWSRAKGRLVRYWNVLGSIRWPESTAVARIARSLRRAELLVLMPEELIWLVS